jgi:hypothetical protein
MAATAVQFTDTDASFLVEVLYHLTGPLIVRGKFPLQLLASFESPS